MECHFDGIDDYESHGNIIMYLLWIFSFVEQPRGEWKVKRMHYRYKRPESVSIQMNWLYEHGESQWQWPMAYDEKTETEDRKRRYLSLTHISRTRCSENRKCPWTVHGTAWLIRNGTPRTSTQLYTTWIRLRRMFNDEHAPLMSTIENDECVPCETSRSMPHSHHLFKERTTNFPIRIDAIRFEIQWSNGVVFRTEELNVFHLFLRRRKQKSTWIWKDRRHKLPLRVVSYAIALISLLSFFIIFCLLLQWVWWMNELE